jgi:hypothetical protein
LVVHGIETGVEEGVEDETFSAEHWGDDDDTDAPHDWHHHDTPTYNNNLFIGLWFVIAFCAALSIGSMGYFWWTTRAV